MNRIIHFIFLLLLVFDIKAQFSDIEVEAPGTTTACPQELVNFELWNSSGDSIYLDWGDGTFRTQNGIPDFREHSWDTSGTFTVVLCVFLSGLPDYDTLFMNILPATFADYGFDTDSICAGGTINFYDSTIGPVSSYSWNFGDPESGGSNTSSLPSPSHTYLLPGKFFPKMTVNDGTCSTSKTKSIVIFEDTSLHSFNWDANPCPCNEIQFNSGGNANEWKWTFGDIPSGNDTSSLQNPTHTFSEPGYYTLSLEATNTISKCYVISKTTIKICPDEIDSSISLSDANWYFGDSAGLSFLTEPPTALADGVVNNFQGGSTVSDPYTGNLLFYTDGSTVWNTNHDTVKNGSGLTANSSASQGSLIVPYPGNPNLYYIFVSPAVSSLTGYRYSIIDVTIDSIIVKNQLLHNGGGNEQLSGVIKTFPTCSTTAEYWIVMPQNSNNIKSYPITAAGIGPVVNNNTNWHVSNSVGVVEIAFSKDRKKMALTGQNGLWLFNFDINTGQLFSPQLLTGITTRGGGTAFSDNGRFLYTTNWGGSIGQTDLFAMNISQSEERLPNKLASRGTMWRGLNSKIYISTGGYQRDSIAVINTPNVKYPGCDYDPFGQYVGPGRCFAGLQNMIPYHIPKIYGDTLQADFIWDSICKRSNIVSFFNLSTIPPPKNACAFYQDDSIQYSWDFGDGDTSSLFEPAHNFIAGNTYTVQLIISRPKTCFSDTMIRQVYIPDSLPSVSYITDSLICLNDSISFNSTVKNIPQPIYQWSAPINSSDTDIVYLFNTAGSFAILLTISDTDNCNYSFLDTIIVNPLPNASINPSIGIICTDSSLVLSASGGNRYLWSTGDTNSNITIDTIGNYEVLVTDSSSCQARDSSSITWAIDNVIANISASDTLICGGSTVNLTASGGLSYEWLSPISLKNITSVQVAPSTNTIYTVITKGICDFEDTAYISVVVTSCDIFIPNAFSPNNDSKNDMFRVIANGLKNYDLKVYDRWGKKIFESDDVNDSWDGQIKGKLANEGAYVYKLNVTFLSNETLSKKGNITLVR